MLSDDEDEETEPESDAEKEDNTAQPPEDDWILADAQDSSYSEKREARRAHRQLVEAESDSEDEDCEDDAKFYSFDIVSIASGETSDVAENEEDHSLSHQAVSPS